MSDVTKYKRQQTLVVKLNEDCKKDFFDNLEIDFNNQNLFGINVSRTFVIFTVKAILIYI